MLIQSLRNTDFHLILKVIQRVGRSNLSIGIETSYELWLSSIILWKIFIFIIFSWLVTELILGERFNLYTHSYLGFGAERARESLNQNLLKEASSSSNIKDPCLNKGFSRFISHLIITYTLVFVLLLFIIRSCVFSPPCFVIYFPSYFPHSFILILLSYSYHMIILCWMIITY